MCTASPSCPPCPRRASEHNVGSVGDVAEHVAHRLAHHDLLGAGLGDGHAGGQGLVGHFKNGVCGRGEKTGLHLKDKFSLAEKEVEMAALQEAFAEAVKLNRQITQGLYPRHADENSVWSGTHTSWTTTAV